MRAPDTLLKHYWSSPARAMMAHGPLRPGALGRNRAGTAVAVDAPAPATVMRDELGALPGSARLAGSGQLSVYALHAAQAPAVVQEVGRLRELTFREVGEGSGGQRDLDWFDSYYTHLVVWDGHAECVVGAYRLGFTDRLPGWDRASALYSNTLFRLSESFLAEVEPAIELGRSFVRREYQRSYAPLALLWKAIGAIIGDAPQYRYLFGPVTISGRYDAASRAMMVRFLAKPERASSLMPLVQPRHPFRPGASARALARLADRADSVEALSRLIAAGEKDGAGVPILLRQYLKLGARSVAFSVDASFGRCLDALCLVDLLATDPRTLRRYMGADAASSYLAAHRRSA